MSPGRVAIVTGASRGLGFALTRGLVCGGWRVVIDARGAADLERAARELARAARKCDSPGEVRALPGDVWDPGHRRALVEAAGDRIDLLVNNAGILGPSPRPRLADYPTAALEELLRVGVLAPLGLIQMVLPRMSAGTGTVINVTSDAAVEPYAGWGGYGAAKAALEQLTAVLAAEEPGARIYALDPGDLRTRMQQEAFPGEDISDRPPPEQSVPAILSLITRAPRSGRYRVCDLAEVAG